MVKEQLPPDYGIVLPPGAQGPIVWLDDAVGVVFKVWSGETGNALAMVEQPIRPEALAAPIHVHYREDEISYVLEGEVTLQLGEQVLRAPQGTLLFKPRGIPHTFWNQTKRPARLLHVFTPGGLERYFQEAAEAGGFEHLSGLAGNYQLELRPESVTAIMRQYGLKHPRQGARGRSRSPSRPRPTSSGAPATRAA